MGGPKTKERMVMMYIEPITIVADKKHDYFDRKVALKEGYRANEEINRKKVKRPFLLARKWQNDYLFNKRDMYGRYNWIIKSFEDKGKSINKIVKKITAKNKLIRVSDLDKHDNLKDKTIFVYVEKHSNNIYTVREDIYRDGQEVVELFCEQFFGVAGEFVIINLDKINGKYHFNYVIPSYEYKDIKRSSHNRK